MAVAWRWEWWSVVLILGLAGGCERKVPAANNGGPTKNLAQRTLLNVSYDPTREFFIEFNQAFVRDWQARQGETVRVEQSHGGSGKQARAVMDGLKADVVSLALSFDVDQIAEKTELISKDWRTRFPQQSAPFTTTIVFVVRKGNPKGIKDWDDLIRPGVEVITPNPKTSGGARLIYLAAWGYGVKKLGSAKQAESYMEKLYKQVPVLDSGARAATTTFAQNLLGDVLLTWENEAFLAEKAFRKHALEVVIPSISILAAPPVALVEANAKEQGNLDLAQAYLEYLYTPEGQRLGAKHYFRPLHPEAAAPEDLARFAKLELFTVEELFGDWKTAQKEHFSDGGKFDQIYDADQ